MTVARSAVMGSLIAVIAVCSAVFARSSSVLALVVMFGCAVALPIVLVGRTRWLRRSWHDRHH
jgi:hypothetical protein